MPGKVRVLTDERYRSVSPNAIPPVVAVEEARVRIDDGVVVPRPTLPEAKTLNIEEDVATLKRFDAPVAVDEATDNSDVGVVVPIPIFPLMILIHSDPLFLFAKMRG